MQEAKKTFVPLTTIIRRDEEILGSGGYQGARASALKAAKERVAIAQGLLSLRPESPSKSELWSLD